MSPKIQKKSKKPTTKHDFAATWLKKKYEFRYNSMTHRYEKRQRGQEESFKEFKVEDLWHELNCCPSDFEKIAGKCYNYSRETLLGLLGVSQMYTTFNPYKEWLENLDYSKEMEKCPKGFVVSPFCQLASLINFLSLEENERERFAIQLEKWFIRAIRCLYDETFASKECIVLAGAQGIGKTPFLRSLLPKKLRGKAIMQNPDTQDKDKRIGQSKFFITMLDEVDEWLALNKRAYKAYMTTLHVNERKPFGHSEESFPRITSFFGTCNTTNFLRDATGTDRWIVFNVESFVNKSTSPNAEFHIEDFPCEALWAWAKNKYNQGETGEIEKEVRAKNHAINEIYRDEPMELDHVTRFFLPCSRDEIGALFMSSSEVAAHILHETGEKLFPVPLGKALMRLGFQKWKNKGKIGYFVKFKKKENE